MKARVATSKDITQIILLMKDLFAMYHKIDSTYTDPADDEIFKEAEKQIELNLADYLVTEDEDGSITGFLNGKIDDRLKVAFLSNIFVIEERRGNGVSNILFNTFKERCLARGVKRINLNSDIRSEAYGMWLHKGFTTFAHRMYLNI